ncbi:LOW QUALITY PROTEIN: hypothetical protein HID58_018745 [Brassica napus]|uniref:SWIM-type domain-containing protein n=1 Tax=Brassica napus TaxID=3708 RepID=A0ABQ8DAT1_BRANA|nr:LOW QUALITY PROTEIN: hypothetical protein HID58_018745 [Brassica napus]
MEMGRLMKLVIGLWSKNSTGEWSFEESSCYTGEAIIINNNESFDGLVKSWDSYSRCLINSPTGCWPMMVHERCRSRYHATKMLRFWQVDYMSEAVLYVTSGPELVARYQFFRRSPFSIDLVGGHPIDCSKHVLKIMFNEPQLLIVFRVALEIEMVYGTADHNGEAEDPAEFPQLTVDDVISMAEAGTISPKEHIYFDPNDEVLYGEPMTIEELRYALPNGQDASLVNQSTPLEVEPINVWRDMTQNEKYWDGISPDENNYEVYYTQSPYQTQGAIGDSTTVLDKINGPGSLEFDIAPASEDNTNNAEPSLDLTLTLGNKKTGNGEVEAVDDSCSESEEGSGRIKYGFVGNEINNSEELYEGKVFTSRGDFKQQMASYTLRRKFWFKNSRYSPDGMVLRCISLTCNWRIYAVKMKNVENYEVRKLNLQHTCSVDERAGMLVCRISASEFDVKDKDAISYHVNLHTKSCSCFSFQTFLIPCAHAIAAAIKEKKSIESLVSEFYTIDTLAAAYARNILPISSDVNASCQATDGEFQSMQIYPPTSRRPPGRPRKSWILSTREIRMKTSRKRHVCSRCKGFSHNKVFDKNGGLSMNK